MGTFLDTNVIVYAFDRSEPEKQARARSILASPPDPLAVSSQVLSEFYAVVTRKLRPPLSTREALAAAGHLARLAAVVPVDAAPWAGCAIVLSGDLTDGQTVGGVTISNPFG